MLIISLDDKKQGIAVIDGVSYRVTGTYGLRGGVTWPSTSERRALHVDLTVVEALDEEQQKSRIERLERQLQDERDRLDEIRRTLNGDEEKTD